MTDETRAPNWLDSILLRYVNRPFGQEQGIECRDAILAALTSAESGDEGQCVCGARDHRGECHFGWHNPETCPDAAAQPEPEPGLPIADFADKDGAWYKAEAVKRALATSPQPTGEREGLRERLATALCSLWDHEDHDTFLQPDHCEQGHRDADDILPFLATNDPKDPT